MTEQKKEQPEQKDLLTKLKERLPGKDIAYVEFGKEKHSSKKAIVDFGDHYKLYESLEDGAIVQYESKMWSSLPAHLVLDKYFLRLVYRTKSGSPAFTLSRPHGEGLMDKISKYAEVEVVQRKWYQKIYGFRSGSRMKSGVAVALYASALYLGSAAVSGVGEFFSGDNEVAVVSESESESSASEVESEPKREEAKKEEPKKHAPSVAISKPTASKEATERAEAIRDGKTPPPSTSSASAGPYGVMDPAHGFEVSDVSLNDHMGLGDGSKIALVTLDKKEGDATLFRKLAQLAVVDVLEQTAETDEISELTLFFEYKGEGPFIKYNFEPDELRPLLDEIRSDNPVLFGDVESRATSVMMSDSLR